MHPHTLAIIGLIIAVTPMLGFPGIVENVVSIVGGLMIAGIIFWAHKGAALKHYFSLPDHHTKDLFSSADNAS